MHKLMFLICLFVSTSLLINPVHSVVFRKTSTFGKRGLARKRFLKSKYGGNGGGFSAVPGFGKELFGRAKYEDDGEDLPTEEN